MQCQPKIPERFFVTVFLISRTYTDFKIYKSKHQIRPRLSWRNKNKMDNLYFQIIKNFYKNL